MPESKSLTEQATKLFEMAERCSNKQMAQALTMQAHALLNLLKNERDDRRIARAIRGPAPTDQG
jgi:hypothetical protein